MRGCMQNSSPLKDIINVLASSTQHTAGQNTPWGVGHRQVTVPLLASMIAPAPSASSALALGPCTRAAAVYPTPHQLIAVSPMAAKPPHIARANSIAPSTRISIASLPYAIQAGACFRDSRQPCFTAATRKRGRGLDLSLSQGPRPRDLQGWD